MPVVVVATMTAKSDSVDKVRQACEQAVEAVHDEPGCQLYSVHEADGTFVFVEQWTGEYRCTEGMCLGAVQNVIFQPLPGRAVAVQA